VSATRAAPRSEADLGDIEQAVSTIVTWATRNDVHQEIMRQAKCALPRGSVWLLAQLARSEPIRLSELATTLGVDKSTLTPQAQRLERAGLIAREQDPNDRRAALLLVTRTGRGLLARLHGTRRAMFEELLADWSERDRAQAAKILTRLAGLLDSSTEATSAWPRRGVSPSREPAGQSGPSPGGAVVPVRPAQ
jgi:DNA-binding MarR family transcriptional regulator